MADVKIGLRPMMEKARSGITIAGRVRWTGYSHRADTRSTSA
jgi:hypothetical protein